MSARKPTAVPQKNTATAAPPTIIAERRPKSLIGVTDENVRSLEHRIYQELSLTLPSSTLTDEAIRMAYRCVLDILCAFDPEHRTKFWNKLKPPKTDGDITEIRQVMATIIAMSGLYKIEKDSQQ